MWLIALIAGASCLYFSMLMIIYSASGGWVDNVMRSRTPNIFMILVGACIMILRTDFAQAALILRIGLIGGRNRTLLDAIERIDRGRSTPDDIDTLIMAWMLTKDYDYMRLIEFVRSSRRGAGVGNADMAFHIATVRYPEWMHD